MQASYPYCDVILSEARKRVVEVPALSLSKGFAFLSFEESI
jgi:hypothetical protein